MSRIIDPFQWIKTPPFGTFWLPPSPIGTNAESVGPNDSGITYALGQSVLFVTVKNPVRCIGVICESALGVPGSTSGEVNRWSVTIRNFTKEVNYLENGQFSGSVQFLPLPDGPVSLGAGDVIVFTATPRISTVSSVLNYIQESDFAAYYGNDPSNATFAEGTSGWTTQTVTYTPPNPEFETETETLFPGWPKIALVG